MLAKAGCTLSEDTGVERRDDEDDVPDFLRPLQDEYRTRLAGQISEFGELWRRSLDGDQSAIESLRESVHRIAGNAGTLGFPRLSQVAYEASLAIARSPTNDAASPALHALIEEMQRHTPLDA